MQEITSQEFIDQLRNFSESHGSQPLLRDLRVSGALQVNDGDFNNGMAIERVLFANAASLARRKFGQSVVFRSCQFEGGLDLSQSAFLGGVEFWDCTFGLACRALDVACLRLSNATIVGDVRLCRVVAHGLLVANGINLRGDWLSSECLIAGDAGSGPVLQLMNANVVGSVALGTGVMDGDLQRIPKRSRYKNLGSARGLDCVTLRSAQISETVDLGFARFTGGLSLDFAQATVVTSGGGVFECVEDEQPQKWSDGSKNCKLQGARIEGNLSLSGGRFALIRLEAVEVDETITLFEGESGQLEITDWFVLQGDSFYVLSSRMGGLGMSKWKCHGSAKIHAREIGGSGGGHSINGIEIKSCEFSRGLSLWAGPIISDQLQNWSDRYKDLLENNAQDVRNARFLKSLIGEPLSTAKRRLQQALHECRHPNSQERFFKFTQSALNALDSDGGIKALQSMVTQEVKTLEKAMRNLWAPGFHTADNQRFVPLLTHNATESSLLSPWTRRMRVTGKVLINRCLIGGDLDVTGLEIIASKNGIGPERQDFYQLAELSCANSTIHGAFYARSPVSLLVDSTDASELTVLQAALVTLQLDPAALITTVCDLLDLRLLAVGMIDISGLSLRAPEIVDRQRVYERRIELDYATVNTDLTTFVRLNPSRQHEWHTILRQVIQSKDLTCDLLTLTHSVSAWNALLAWIANGDAEPMKASLVACVDVPGAIDLQHAKIGGELRLCDHSFATTKKNAKPSEIGIVLDFCQVRKLSVARGLAGETKNDHNGFPRPISLLAVQVTAWFLEGAHEHGGEEFDVSNREADSSNCFLDLLDNDPQYRSSTYTAVERSLKDRGLDDEAKSVLVAGRFRDKRDAGAGALSREGLVRRLLVKIRWRISGRICTLHEVSERLRLCWRPGLGRKRKHVRYLPAFRLSRPRHEFAATILALLWFFGCWPYALAWIIADGLSVSSMLMAASVVLISVYPLRPVLMTFVDRLYWTFLDYGTSAGRLALLVLTLSFVSFAFVSGDGRNFEPTLQAQIAAQTSSGAGKLPDHPQAGQWGRAERLWMTLSHHVPLVSANVLDEWQPANTPLRISGLTEELDAHGAPLWWHKVDRYWPHWWPLPAPAWPQARDWFGAMDWLNWLLWPLFLPFLVRKLQRIR